MTEPIDLTEAAELASTTEQEYVEDREAFVKRMEETGHKVEYPADNEAQLDIDTEEQWLLFLKLWDILYREIVREYGTPPYYHTVYSDSGPPHRHVKVILPFIIGSHWERCAWQAALGSDPTRELLGCIRTMRNDEHPTLLVHSEPTK